MLILKKNIYIYIYNTPCLDMPRHNQLLFQDPATRFLEFAVNFHHDVMLIMLCFFCLVLWFIIRINLVFNMYPDYRYKKILNNKMVFLPNIRNHILFKYTFFLGNNAGLLGE